MNAEKQIRIAARMYECRDTARFMCGERYGETMQTWARIIQAKAKVEKVEPLAAAVGLVKEAKRPSDRIIIIAAAVELLEPS